MTEQLRLQDLKDIETRLAIIRKHNKRPYAYRLIDHGEIHGALNMAQSLLKSLIEDVEQIPILPQPDMTRDEIVTWREVIAEEYVQVPRWKTCSCQTCVYIRSVFDKEH